LTSTKNRQTFKGKITTGFPPTFIEFFSKRFNSLFVLEAKLLIF